MTRREIIEQYLEDLSKRFVPISHTDYKPQFVRLFEDVKKKRKYSIDIHRYTMIVLSYAERKSVSPIGFKVRKRMTVSFAICRTPEANVDQSNILGNTEKYSDEIESQMIIDFMEEKFLAGALETESFLRTEQEIEIEGIGLVGHIVEFSYSNAWCATVNAENWQTI